MFHDEPLSYNATVYQRFMAMCVDKDIAELRALAQGVRKGWYNHLVDPPSRDYAINAINENLQMAGVADDQLEKLTNE